MPKRKILTFGHPALKTVCDEVTEFDQELQAIAEDMRETLFATNFGVGLAAPQIGVTKRIVLIRDQIIVNPVINGAIGQQTVKEGCLSYPGIERAIKRPLSVVVSGYDAHGEEIVKTYKGIDAAIACHEVDHLNGICKVGERPKRVTSPKKKKKRGA
ncbi:peptide deformylase [Bacillus atrophaeus]|uniref:peptide deformylase n=1 Tax=Bacillus atrophaeus TaxID=1452 RepID=UPI002280F11F|nr:peptide deformylase [Bacillus atrophaeus]MCY8890378.1 peptide deformylase [Bacillus spizizenii]MEC0842104.1 peptide deformylase [Bacillus spizizenii]MED1125277.1 peptide deformylase [Bacillus atrophaeus]